MKRRKKLQAPSKAKAKRVEGATCSREGFLSDRVSEKIGLISNLQQRSRGERVVKQGRERRREGASLPQTAR